MSVLIDTYGDVDYCGYFFESDDFKVNVACPPEGALVSFAGLCTDFAFYAFMAFRSFLNVPFLPLDG